MSQLSDVELEQLRSRLLPFAAEWTGRTGRELATLQDGIDFLASMKGRAEFWTCLAPRDPRQDDSVDVGAIRALLPTNALVGDRAAEDYLRSIGLSEEEVRALVHELDEAASFDGAIRAAFAQDRPQAIARALERILATKSDVLATQRYVSRFAGASGIARSIGTAIGIALFMLGTACGPSERAEAPAPRAPSVTVPTAAASPDPTEATPPEPAPADTPPPEPVPEVAASPEPEPAPPITATAAVPEPEQARPRRPRRPGPGTPMPAPAYKGVSPRAWT